MFTSSQHPPSNCLIGTEFLCSAGTNAQDPWLQFNLYAPATLRAVSIYNRLDCCFEQLGEHDAHGVDLGALAELVRGHECPAHVARRAEAGLCVGGRRSGRLVPVGRGRPRARLRLRQVDVLGHARAEVRLTQGVSSSWTMNDPRVES